MLEATVTRRRRVRIGGGCGLLLLACLWDQGTAAQGLSSADDLTVRPVTQRLSDEAIEADRQVFRHIRKKLEAAKVGAASSRACMLAKAEAWLHVAEEEYDENEEGEIVDATLRESQRLLRSPDDSPQAMQGQSPLHGSPARARPDLRRQLEQLKARGEFCACETLARLEVQLSWADHELSEGAVHAAPYIEVAERLAASAAREVDAACPLTVSVPDPSPPADIAPPADEPPVVAVAAPEPEPSIVAPEPSVIESPPPASVMLSEVPAPVPQEPPHPIEPEPAATPEPLRIPEPLPDPETLPDEEPATAPSPPRIPESLSAPETLPKEEPAVISLATLPWSVHFSTNRATISPSTAKVLDRMSEVLLRHPIAKIRLEGHADQRGEASYNKMLSERRAQAVKAYLVKAGIASDHISAAAFGKTQPLNRSRRNHDLAKNRRVVIVVTNIQEVRSEVQYADLQPDHRKRKKPAGEATPSSPLQASKTAKKNRTRAQR